MADEIYSSSYWGNGVCDNTIDWGVVYKDYAGCTPSFTNTYSLSMDGVDDFLETTKTAALTTASLSMWVKVTGNFAVNERQSLASNDDFNHGRDFIIADTPTTTNDAYIGLFAGGIIYGKTSASGGIAINDGNWHHLVWTYDGSAGTSASINMYVDGQNQYSNASYSSYWSYEIKFQYFGKPTSANTYFSGSMDEVAYFNSILSPSDVTTIYNSGVPNDISSISGLSAWYRCGDNGTWKSPQWLIPENSNKDKFSNYSFEYDGVDDYILVSGSILPSAGDMTVSAWVKFNDTTSLQGIFESANYYTTGFNGGFGLRANGVGLSAAFSNGTSFVYNIEPAGFTIGDWFHVAFTFNNTSKLGTYYVNGSSIGTYTFNSAYDNADLVNGAELGRVVKNSSYILNGNLDEVSVFSSVLTQAQITQIYNSGVPTNLSSLSPVGYWRSENSTFSTNWTVTDNGSGSNDGTSANMTIEDRVGDASNSSNNAVSFNQVEADRETDVPT